jgi:hypothetical protein
MRGNWVDSRLLVVGSQIGNLTPNPYFGHNLCFRCPNEQCETILDIYVSIFFQWYKELFKPMGLDPCNRILKIQKSIWDSNSHNGSSLESKLCDSRVFFLGHNLATLCLGREPKARVVTTPIWRVGVLMDSQIFKRQLQGVKTHWIKRIIISLENS